MVLQFNEVNIIYIHTTILFDIKLISYEVEFGGSIMVFYFLTTGQSVQVLLCVHIFI